MNTQQPAPKKKKVWLWIIGIIGALVVFGCIGSIVMNMSGSHNPTDTLSSSTSNTQGTSSQQTPEQSQKWTTTHTYSGSGIKKTGTFTVGNDWKLQWKCNPASFIGGTYNIAVVIHNSDGTLQDVAINTLCKAGNTSGETEEHQAGDIYLDINSEADWTFTIQELK